MIAMTTSSSTSVNPRRLQIDETMTSPPREGVLLPAVKE